MLVASDNTTDLQAGGRLLYTASPALRPGTPAQSAPQLPPKGKEGSLPHRGKGS